jgi:hypothetical protein
MSPRREHDRPRVTEELEVLAIVTGRLEAADIPYMVTGSVAANYYAVPRMTRDIDLVVELSEGDADRSCALFEGDFYVERNAVRTAIDERSVFNLIHQAYVIKVDCIVRNDSEYRRTEFGRRRRGTVEAHDLAFVAPEDLIISKLDWMRRSVTDTPPEVMRQYHAMLLARSPADRLKMGCSMSATARALARASVLGQDPHASPAALRRALFLRFYGHEFDATERERILAWLGQDEPPRRSR